MENKCDADIQQWENRGVSGAKQRVDNKRHTREASRSAFGLRTGCWRGHGDGRLNRQSASRGRGRAVGSLPEGWDFISKYE